MAVPRDLQKANKHGLCFENNNTGFDFESRVLPERALLLAALLYVGFPAGIWRLWRSLTLSMQAGSKVYALERTTKIGSATDSDLVVQVGAVP